MLTVTKFYVAFCMRYRHVEQFVKNERLLKLVDFAEWRRMARERGGNFLHSLGQTHFRKVRKKVYTKFRSST